jgi:8-amino-7-oxononanoate synthase
MKESYAESDILRKVAKAKGQGLYPFFRPIEASDAASVTIDKRRLINIGSNNYLGLTHHPRVKEAAIEAIEQYGSGCTGSRFLNGNLDLHDELEERLARFLGRESTVVFSTGMQANLGALSTLAGPGDCLLLDSENHASLLDAARLAFGRAYKFRHNDLDDLVRRLEANRERCERMIIVVDGVFSISGEIAPLPELAALSRHYHALLYLDDAHGLGVLGPGGRGTPAHFGPGDHVDIHMGTFSKAFAAIGGMVCGDRDTMEYIRHTARSFIFSAAIPPSVAATVLACLEVMEGDASIHARLWENVRFMADGLAELGLLQGEPRTPILPIHVGDELKAMRLTRFLMEHGIFATPILAPAVAPGEAVIRTSYMASHERADLERVLEVFKLADREFGLASEACLCEA